MDNNSIDKIITKHKSERGALISILHDIQREEGYVPDDVMGYLSKTLEIPISEIFRVVSYFNRVFSLKPRKKHNIKVCQGTACHLKHSNQVLTEIKEEIGEKDEPDFHIEQIRCLGCCTVAPAVEINGEIVDKDSAKKSIIKLKGEK
jgi:NADH:ubiquinone oxidoreductase subunit E